MLELVVDGCCLFSAPLDQEIQGKAKKNDKEMETEVEECEVT